MGNILAAWAPLLYGGVLSSGVGYTLQVLGQKETKPAVASLLMSLESVFAVLAGIVLLHQVPSGARGDQVCADVRGHHPGAAAEQDDRGLSTPST